jgi:hypothetical protein
MKNRWEEYLKRDEVRCEDSNLLAFVFGLFTTLIAQQIYLIFTI